MLWILAAIVFLIWASASVGGGYYLYRMAVSREGVRQKEPVPDARHLEWQRSIRRGADWFWKQNPEFVHIRSRDGLELYGYVLTRPDARRTVLCAHGYRSAPDADYGLQARFLYEHGCNLLLIDQRSHGRSEGRAITYGVRERFDVQDWMEYWSSRPEAALPFYLYGISMGAATVLMASGLELAGNLRGIIADCGFTSPYAIFYHVLTDNMHIPEFPLMQTSRIFVRRLGGFDMEEYSTLEALRTNRTPVLFIHGEDDNFVPTRMSRENYAACTAEKELWIVPGAAHAESFLVETAEYERRLQEFFDRHDA